MPSSPKPKARRGWNDDFWESVDFENRKVGLIRTLKRILAHNLPKEDAASLNETIQRITDRLTDACSVYLTLRHEELHQPRGGDVRAALRPLKRLTAITFLEHFGRLDERSRTFLLNSAWVLLFKPGRRVWGKNGFTSFDDVDCELCLAHDRTLRTEAIDAVCSSVHVDGRPQIFAARIFALEVAGILASARIKVTKTGLMPSGQRGAFNAILHLLLRACGTPLKDCDELVRLAVDTHRDFQKTNLQT